MSVGASGLEGMRVRQGVAWRPSIRQFLVLLVALVASIAAGYVGYQQINRPAPPPTLNLAAVQRGPLVTSVSTTGNVVATRQARLTFATSGRLASVDVKVGDTVSAGQQLAQLDTPQLRLKVEQAESSLRTAQLRLDAFKAGARPEDVAAAKAAYDSALAKLADVTAGPADADLRAAEQSLMAAQAQVAKAQSDLVTLRAGPDADSVRLAEQEVEKAKSSLWSAQLSRDGVCSRGKGFTCDGENARVMAAELSLQQTQIRLAQAQEGAKPEELAAAEQQVDTARAQLAAAQARLDALKAGPKSAEIQAARSSVASAQAQLALKQAGSTAQDIAIAEESIKQAEIALKQARLDLQNATLTAPFAGVAAAVGANVGEQIGGGAAVVSLVDPTQFRVDVNVDEADIGRVAPGKPAVITVDALNRRIQGRVLSVAPSGTVQQGVVTYLVSVGAEGDATLPAGMTVNVTIIADQKANALVVPSRAIRRQGRDQIVEIIADGKPQTRVVRTGLVGEQQTEIVEGLAEGEQVVIPATTTANPTRIGGGFGAPAPAPGVPIRR
ncbi:MAG: efflux RND transporter periplasmic adaptor subunit [Chloroflexi bacterium]|nr:efflux RND transporter periplasmic adaptor subunit [Chloroflexota bacterium]